MSLKVDSPVILAGIRIADLLILNLLWIAGCLPVVTAGASTIAAFTLTLKMVEEREQPAVFIPFWKAFAANLKHGVPLTLIFLAAVYSIWLDAQLFAKLPGNTLIFLIVAFLAGFFLLIHFLYVCPLEARYENTMLGSLANSRRIFMRFFVRTLGLMGILVIQAMLFTQISPLLLYAGFFCLPVLMIYTTSQVVMPIFRKIEGDGEASDGFAIDREGYTIH